MKPVLSSILIFLLTLVLLGQMTASTYVSTREFCNMESPIEEVADEDTDNEGETCKLFHLTAIENTDLFYFVSHHSHHQINAQELIFEIVPPPPKQV